MNKAALKSFATNARKELIEKVKAQAFRIGITEEGIKKAEIESSDRIYIDEKPLDANKKKQREKLISRIKEIGYKQLVEEVAYTWFNRFTALRFMEVNNYLPTKVRVLSSINPDSLEPDIVKEALSVDLDVDKEYVYALKLKNDSEELFKYLILKQCNALNNVLPFMFETIDDYKEILFPEGLLANASFLREMTNLTVIPESDWEQVEIIGWLYQFYIAEEKDRVFKAKKRYKTEEIPFATQLFTPDWIVRYMVQNSLGRYWIESHPNDITLIDKWDYYLENRNLDSDVVEEVNRYINKELKVEDIKCFDPAMGSGHILVYMFDVLFNIYIKCGYMEREVPKLIIENNLYGLDIDDRAYQLACFSVVMKAMQYNSRFFRSIERDGLSLNLASIQETNSLNEQDIAYIAGESKGSRFDQTEVFVKQFKNAKSIGSLIKISSYERLFLEERLAQIKTIPDNDIFMGESRNKTEHLIPLLLKQLEIMRQQYDIVVTNPPYMGNKYMNEDLSEFLQKEYPDTKYDTFASFMELDQYLKPNSFFAMINQHSWMFLSSYEKLRRKIISQKTILSMIHLGTRAFEEIGGEIVQSTAFILRKFYIENFKGEYIRLVGTSDSKEKELKFQKAIKNPDIDYRYFREISAYRQIPGSPIVYWMSERFKEVFSEGVPLSQMGDAKSGLQTGNNDYFLKYWNEVDINKIGFNFESLEEATQSRFKWFPHVKGGSYRKWYGNFDYIVNFANSGYEIKNHEGLGVLRSPQLYFKEGITWSHTTSVSFGSRILPKGFIFNVEAPTIYNVEDKYLLFGLLNSKITDYILSLLNDTIHYLVGDMKKIPIMLPTDEETKEYVRNMVRENISMCKVDWDSYEISWEYKRHPILLNKENTISESYEKWDHISKDLYAKLKKNEEELNRVFIEVYGLQNEMDTDSTEESISIRKANPERDIKSLLSYAVGCIFGRYSLDEEGIVFAGGKFDLGLYKTLTVDKDNILPMLSNAYFEDDLVTRFIEFVKITFGEEKMLKNLEFIASCLGRKEEEAATETIRRYFLTDFFRDHLQIYKKKPIYWLFTSGKQKAFNCLIYMHRYDKSTLSRIRTDYLHELQIRMDAEKKSLLDIINGDGTTKEISNAKKELKSLDLKIEELREYDEKLHHMADMQIEIDLDDGVAVNYAKFEGLLAPIK